MPAQVDLSKLSVRQFAERFKSEMIPLSNTFSYFCASVPHERRRPEGVSGRTGGGPASRSRRRAAQNLDSPGSLPRTGQWRTNQRPKTSARETNRGKLPPRSTYPSRSRCTAASPPPPSSAWAAETVLAFALKDQEVAEYHYRFYHLLATVLGEQWTEAIETGYSRVMRDELNSDVHGEVDEASWRLKQALRRSQATMSAKAFRAYARQSFIDTLTLYLHGICCDIDVDTGPRQLPSRYLRKRLLLLQELFPPPHGYAVFPEQLGS